MISVDNVAFSYTRTPFLRDITFHLGPGEIFGFLGPSGAGKSTLQKILTGSIRGYSGSAVVNGVEARRCTSAFYEDIGVDFEFSTLFEKLTARETLRYFASLYRRPSRDADGLLAAVDLLQAADKPVSQFSKGMKSRLNFIRALQHDPAVLFLDEPTSGLDPASARVMKDMILTEQRGGKAIILTTHNMVDAAELCHTVAFIVEGRIAAMDSPRSLMLRAGAATVTYTCLEGGREIAATCPLAETGADEKLRALVRNGGLHTIHSGEPTLDDVFRDVTGRALQ